MVEDRAHTNKFDAAARAVECGQDAERFRERVSELVKHELVDQPQ